MPGHTLSRGAPASQQPRGRDRGGTGAQMARAPGDTQTHPSLSAPFPRKWTSAPQERGEAPQDPGGGSIAQIIYCLDVTEEEDLYTHTAHVAEVQLRTPLRSQSSMPTALSQMGCSCPAPRRARPSHWTRGGRHTPPIQAEALCSASQGCPEAACRFPASGAQPRGIQRQIPRCSFLRCQTALPPSPSRRRSCDQCNGRCPRY